MKRTFVINGQIFKTVLGADGALKAFNRKNPSAKLIHCSEAYEFREVRKGDAPSALLSSRILNYEAKKCK